MVLSGLAKVSQSTYETDKRMGFLRAPLIREVFLVITKDIRSSSLVLAVTPHTMGKALFSDGEAEGQKS